MNEFLSNKKKYSILLKNTSQYNKNVTKFRLFIEKLDLIISEKKCYKNYV